MFRTFAIFLAVIGCGLAGPFAALAQNNGNNGNNNGNVGGIRIDADGVLSMAIRQDQAGALEKKQRAALAKKALPGDVGKASPQRMVSLVRLETVCAEHLEQGESLPDETKFLAGLTRLDCVYIDPDDGDLILAGPAEPFARGESGRVIGLESGRPVLRLDDFIVALRSVASDQMLGCSIDPVPERTAKLHQFIQQNSGPATHAVIEQRYRRMIEILGNHHVRIMGVPNDSHFARGLVEADFRMKLLTLGLEKPGVKGFRSHLSMAGKAEAMHRWWFVPLYDRIVRTADGLAFELAGQRAQLLGEDELANAAGERSASGTNKVSTLDYSRQFTEKFPQLAARMPVFAELQQLIDWAVCAALIQRERLAERIEWTMPVFSDAGRLPHEVWPVPKETPCLLNLKTAGDGAIIGEFAGGVTIRPAEILNQMSPRSEHADSLAARRAKALDRAAAKDHPWWWD